MYTFTSPKVEAKQENLTKKRAQGTVNKSHNQETFLLTQHKNPLRHGLYRMG